MYHLYYLRSHYPAISRLSIIHLHLRALAASFPLHCLNCCQMTESVERMSTKERFINSHHDHLREEYRQVTRIITIVTATITITINLGLGVIYTVDECLAVDGGYVEMGTIPEQSPSTPSRAHLEVTMTRRG